MGSTFDQGPSSRVIEFSPVWSFKLPHPAVIHLPGIEPIRGAVFPSTDMNCREHSALSRIAVRNSDSLLQLQSHRRPRPSSRSADCWLEAKNRLLQRLAE